MTKLLLSLFCTLFGFLCLSAQTEDTLVVELLYRADYPTTDNQVYIDRATVYHYGEVVASAPLEHFDSLEFAIKDTFGTLGRKGEFTFYREMLPDLKDKIPVQVTLNGKYAPGFIKIASKKSLRFNFYTDKIKPVLNFWINVEGIAKDSSILPLSADELLLSTSYGEIQGLELILPEDPKVESVTLKACLLSRPTECTEETVPIMKKDARGHWEDEEEYNPDLDADGNTIKPKDDNPNVPGYIKKSYYIEDEGEDFEDEESLLDEDTTEEESDYEESNNKWDFLFKKVFRKKKTED